MFGVEPFPLCWEEDLEHVTDIHMTHWYHANMEVRLRRHGALSCAPWSAACSSELWNWLMWHGALLQRDLQQPQHSMLRHAHRALRIAYAPMLLGQRLAVRLHQQDADLLPLPEAFWAYAPGLTVMFGVTGSGKTTRAYQCLDQLSRQYMVVAIEDPPECLSLHWPQFDRAILQDEAAVHHLVLRQNPDVLFWGELRDRQAWLCVENWVTTGLHVLTTVHARDAQQCLDRLRLWGAGEDFLARYMVGMQHCIL